MEHGLLIVGLLLIGTWVLASRDLWPDKYNRLDKEEG